MVVKEEEEEEVKVVEMKKNIPCCIIPFISQGFADVPENNPHVAIKLLNLLGGEDIEINGCDSLSGKEYIMLRENPKGVDCSNMYFKTLMERHFLSHSKADPSGEGMWRINFADDMRDAFFNRLSERDIAIGDFSTDKQDLCAVQLLELQDYVVSGCEEEETVWEDILVSLNKSLNDYFEGFNNLNLNKIICKERTLQVVIRNVFQRLCKLWGSFTYYIPERSMKDRDGNQGYTDIWLVDKQSKTAVITELRWGGHESHLQKYTSVYGLNEAIGSKHRERKVNYRDKWFDERKGVFKNLIFLSIAINRQCRSSISVTFTRNPPNDLQEPYYCVSDTEQHYGGYLKYEKFEFLESED